MNRVWKLCQHLVRSKNFEKWGLKRDPHLECLKSVLLEFRIMTIPMDKFLIKRSRATEETQETQEAEQEQEIHENQPPPLKFGGLKSLALYNPNPAILALGSSQVF